MKNDNDKPRLYLYDNLKFLLIVMVVVGHFSDALATHYYSENPLLSKEGLPLSEIFNKIFVFLYAFHMPLFMFLSGLFHKNGEKLNITKAVTYFVLGVLLKMVISLSSVIFSTTDKGVSDLHFSFFSGDGVYWYLLALSAFILIAYLFRNANPVFVLVFSVLLALFAGYDNNIGDDYQLSRIIVFFPYFYAGSLIDPQKLSELMNKVYIKIVSVLLILVWAYFSFMQLDLVYPLRSMFTGRNSYDDMTDYSGVQSGLQYRLIAMAIAFVVSFAFLGISLNTKIPFVTEAGARTLQVYFWHKIVEHALLYFEYPQSLSELLPSCWQIVYVLTAVLTAVVLSFKPFGKPLDAIIGYIRGYNKTEKKR